MSTGGALGAGVEQLTPCHPGSHMHVPLWQVPLPEQLLLVSLPLIHCQHSVALMFIISAVVLWHAAPEYPASHKHVPLKQLPLLEQFCRHMPVREREQSLPVHSGSHMHVALVVCGNRQVP